MDIHGCRTAAIAARTVPFVPEAESGHAESHVYQAVIAKSTEVPKVVLAARLTRWI